MLFKIGVFGHGPVELLENIDHRGGSARRFPATVELSSDATCVGLFLVFNQQNFMNHRTQRRHRQLLQRIGHRLRHQIRVVRRAADDQPQCDDAGRRIAIQHRRHHHRDFKGTWHSDQVDPSLRHQFTEFLDGIVHHRIRELFIVFRRHDADPDFGSDDAGFGLQRRRHERGMAGGGGKVNRQPEGFTARENFAWRSGLGVEDPSMVSFPEALRRLLEISPSLAVETCRLEDAAGRVLRETVVADRPVPAFDRVMMDGFALRSRDWAAGHREFHISGSAPAGAPATALPEQAVTCLEVMTGAPCPAGADLIIPVEDVLETTGGTVRFGDAADPVAGRFIHRAGSDAVENQILLEPGLLLGSREIGVAASCGAACLVVSKIPRIAVIATGDELVAVDQIPAPHQIRQSNGHSLAAALTLTGWPPQVVRVLQDDLTAARPVMEALLSTNDWLILTGAVSKGSRDFVPALLAELGCREIFHGISQRPGKPAGCWIGPDGQVIVALPGNPVSALTGLHTLVFPALAVASGLPLPPLRRVVMDDKNQHLEGLTRHLPVTLRTDGRAEPAATGNSGDFIGLLRSDGFVTLPPRGAVSTAYPFTPWR